MSSWLAGIAAGWPPCCSDPDPRHGLTHIPLDASCRPREGRTATTRGPARPRGEVPMHACGFFPPMPVRLGLLAILAAPVYAAEGVDNPAPDAVVATQQLHYRRMFEEKPFPTATVTYHANGYYRIHSDGEDHHGVYVMQGRFEDETYTVRYVSLPSPTGWQNRIPSIDLHQRRTCGRRVHPGCDHRNGHRHRAAERSLHDHGGGRRAATLKQRPREPPVFPYSNVWLNWPYLPAPGSP